MRSLRGLLASELSEKSLPAALKLLSIIEDAIKPTAGDGISKAPKVFAIPELLECILSFCDWKDLLVLKRLNRATKSTMEKSIILRRKMMIEPDRDGYFATPFATVAALQERSLPRQPFALSIIPQTPHEFANGPLVVTGWSLEFDISGKRFFDKMSLGERALDMLICQPPISEIFAWAQCCVNDLFCGPTVILRSQTGVTLRQLKDAYHRVKSEHKACIVNGIPGLDCHDLEDGSINPDVNFTGEFQLDLEDDDPILAAVQNAYRNQKKEQLLMQAKSEKLGAYVSAKAQGKWLSNFIEIKTCS